MSMQSLLVVKWYSNLSEAVWDMYVEAQELHTQLVRCIKDTTKRRCSERVALETRRRTLPDLRRGVMHQQYPQFGRSWPNIKRKHAHDRKTKHRDYSKRSAIFGKGSFRAVRYNPDASFLEEALQLPSFRRAERTLKNKRVAKRINNKRRRAEDKREIAREMGLWADDPQHDDAVDAFDGLAWCYVRGTGLEVYPANVFVPASPEHSGKFGGANLDMLYADDFTN